ncbi:MAG: hypothetical protein ACRC14_09995, partial [Paracoccaceae bacterium]
MKFSEDELLVLDTLDIAGGLSSAFSNGGALRDWASRLIDRGFSGAAVSTLWLEASALYPTEQSVLVGEVLKEINLAVEVLAKDRDLMCTYLRVAGLMQRERIDPIALYDGIHVSAYDDTKIRPLHDLAIRIDVALHGQGLRLRRRVDRTRF